MKKSGRPENETDT
jgi:hypothetical protein